MPKNGLNARRGPSHSHCPPVPWMCVKHKWDMLFMKKGFIAHENDDEGRKWNIPTSPRNYTDEL